MTSIKSTHNFKIRDGWGRTEELHKKDHISTSGNKRSKVSLISKSQTQRAFQFQPFNSNESKGLSLSPHVALLLLCFSSEREREREKGVKPLPLGGG